MYTFKKNRLLKQNLLNQQEISTYFTKIELELFLIHTFIFALNISLS